jgi:hydrogenase expression/formation protein HypE
MEGMLRIADEKEEDLRKRFAPGFIKQIHSYEAQIFALEEVWKARGLGATRIWQVGVGGILAALWNVAKEMESGIEIDLKKLEVRQETIEVCEYFRLNPYQLTSAGSMLILAEDGEVMAEALRETGVQATVIGRLTDNNDKIIRNGEEVRYIDRPAPDEIMKIYGGEDTTC